MERDLDVLCDPPLNDLPVAVSLSSDPYPQTPGVNEAQLKHTRKCLQKLTEAGRWILVQTKSDSVIRDLDVLDPRRTLIGLTITAADADLAR
jgi:DNA repair photolyase